MIKHLNKAKLFLLTLLLGASGTANLFAQTISQGAVSNHAFTVNSSGNQVLFSQGNLQYIGSASTPYWKFAEHQWDYLGTTTGQNSSDQNVDRDLFGWGTSGYNHGAVYYQPWSTSTTYSDYYAYGNSSFNLFNQTGQADWGYNAISNGGNTENSGWRTLTKDEWVYLFNTRSTTSGIRYAKAQVNDVNGVILLPDDWNISYYMLSNTNASDANFTSNTITASQWNTLEQHGAVFLPAAGYRGGTTVNYVGSWGGYWSASYYNSSRAYNVYFGAGNLYADYAIYRYDGFSVRLVCPAGQYSIDINATPCPVEGGTVSGGGAYAAGTECTLTATPSAGYYFTNWTENGDVVSVDATYTFTVFGERNLVANFAPFISQGAVSGQAFTVNSSGSQVLFSQGNLQYIGSASTPYWKFAEHQWDCLGDNGQGSTNSDVDRDLFGWGTSGYNHGAVCYQPWSTSTTNSDYFAYGNRSFNLFNQTGQADWGYNAISNGGNTENNGWRTLTKDEWEYVFNTRITASGIRYAKAKVNNVIGVILLPDDWSSSYFTLNNTNTSNTSYTSNTITASQWNTLEQHGAVFLPAAGSRDGTSVLDVGSGGYYWSASYVYIYNINAYNVYFGAGYLGTYDSRDRYYGFSVRLVCPAGQYSFSINATPCPVEGGTVSGGGAYVAGTECTLTATPSAGYTFVYWTENDVVVSTNASYTFTVYNERNLVANFVQEGNITFADANVKTLCVTNWDTNGDGELSYTEAAVVRSLGNVFKNNTNIHSFNELQYFILLESIGEQAFYGCTELTQVTIPEYVNSIGSKAFWNCPALQTVRFNAINCTSMQTTYNSQTYSVFAEDASGSASNVKSVVLGANVQRIPDYAFKNCVDIYPGLTIRNSVTEIGAHAFEGCSSMTNLAFQSNSALATIGDYAFNGCSALNKALNLPNSVTTVGQYAFYGCVAIPSLTIGTGMESIGGYAFWNCPAMTTVTFNATNCTQMKTQTGSSGNIYYSVFNSGTSNGGATPIVTLNIGSNVTKIPDYAFYNSGSINGTLIIGDAVTTIGKYAFYGCNNFIGDLTIPNSVSSIGEYAFRSCSGFHGTLTLPVNESFTTINPYTFYGCSGLSGTLMIPANVTTVSNSAFLNCSSFTGALVLHDAMTLIGQYAFYGCSNLSGLTIGTSVTSIGGYAFWNCPNLTTVHFNATNCTQMYTQTGSSNNYVYYSVFNSGTSNGGATPIVTLSIGENVTKIPNYAFRNSNNMTCDILIPDAVTSIGTYAFANCSGHNVIIGSGVTNIDDYAFYQSSGFNGTLFIGDAVTNIGQYAFQGCSGFTGDLVIPNAVTTLGQYAFSGCSGFNGSLIIGTGVQTINQNTFAGCSGFAGSLILGTQVNSIGNNAFQNCNSFALLITENPNPVTATSSSFTGMNYSIPVYVPDGLVSNYQSATGWNNFTNYIEQFTFWQELDTDNWSDELNWLSMELPGENDVVCVTHNCDVDIDVNVLHVYVYNINDVLTVKSNKTLTTTYGLGIVQPSQLVMEEGSQLYNTIPGIYGTVRRQISGYGTGNDGWYTIAAPVYGGMPISGLTTGTYDLYYYDEPTHYWMNVKLADNNFTTLNPAQGYLYANQSPKTVNLAGQLNASNAQISIPVTYTAGELAGFNLVGNPYTNNISIGDVKINGTAQTAFYRAEGGSNLLAYVAADNEPIKPGDGFFVKATEEGTLTFGSAQTRGESQQDGYVRLVLRKEGSSTGSETVVADRAYLRMNEGERLEKMSTSTAHSLLYFENGGSRYAVANNEAVNGVMPLFLEKANGTYSIEATLLNAECGYLHLIDNMTGADIDLLETPVYSFEAKTTDYASRFNLVFSSEGDGPSTGSGTFAFIDADGNIIVNNGPSTGLGTSILQVVDVMGRIMMQEENATRVSTSGMTPGVYVLRLINGDSVRTQKIVIK